MAKKYKIKPIIVEALQFNGYNKMEVEEFINAHCAEYTNTVSFGEDETFLVTHIGEDLFAVNKGFYIIKDETGELSVVPEDKFKKCYESLD